MSGPLTSLRIIEWSAYAGGSIAGLMLGDLGADVIKLEDASAAAEPNPNDDFPDPEAAGLASTRSAYYELLNWGKRSVSLNLRDERGSALARRLLKAADAIVVHVRSGLPAEVGLDYERLSSANPRLVYGVLTPYGSSGPRSMSPFVDGAAEALSGGMWGVGTEGDPPFTHLSRFTDSSAGVMLSLGIMVALLDRRRLGLGQKVEVSNLGAAMWSQYYQLATTLLTGRPHGRVRRQDSSPLSNHYLCQDGVWLLLANARRDDVWNSFCRVVGLERLLSDARYSNASGRTRYASEIVSILDEHFMTRPYDYWAERLASDNSMIFERVQTLADVGADPQALANDYVGEIRHPRRGPVQVVNSPVHFSATRLPSRGPAPERG